ncbi:type II toxin-antitoxin system VapC family toxin [bacterium]|nr:type II toxin-antitoxin system VapC family toxin [bacterium]
MIIIDSSAWIEFLSGGKKAGVLEKYFKPSNKIIIPSIVIYEVYKKIKSEKGESEAVFIIAQMERLASDVVEIDHPLAVLAADLSIQKKLPMADAMIYAVAIHFGATIITLDKHFKDLEFAKCFG